MNPLQLNILVKGCGRRRNWGDGAGGDLLVGGRGKVPIETSRAIPTNGGASRSDFAKVRARVREEQEKCTHLGQIEHFSESLPTVLPHESTKSRGNVGALRGTRLIKVRVLVGGTLGEGLEGTQAS